MEILCFKNGDFPCRTHCDQISKEDYIWIDCTPEELPEAQDILKKYYDITLYERHVEDCVNPLHACSFESVQDYYLLVFRSLVDKVNVQTLETSPICFIAAEKILVTISQNNPFITKAKNKLTGVKKKNTFCVEFLIYYILNLCIDNFLESRTQLFEEFNNWENVLLYNNKAKINWRSFLNFKSTIRQLSVLSEEQEDVIIQWHDDLDVNINETMAVRIHDLADHAHRVLRHIQRVESDLESLVQLHYLVVGQRTNEIVRVLTVISCIFMPLTLITGIFGMNFQHMRILTYSHAYPFTLLGMVVITIFSLLIFRWKKWI